MARWSRPYPTVARRVLSSLELIVVVVVMGVLTALIVGVAMAVVVFGLIRAVNS